MSNEILIKALSLIARTDGGVVELNARACYLLARSALNEYTAQQSAQADICENCGGWLKGGECENCNSPVTPRQRKYESL